MMKAKLTNKQVEDALLQCVSLDSLHHRLQHSTDALCTMITVCCAADRNLLPAKAWTLMCSLVCCATAAVEGVASQAGAPPPEIAEALDAGKHHSGTCLICVLHSA